jgi:hypothetical protein
MGGEASRRNGKKGGRPKGTVTQGTLDKLAAREYVRQQVTAALAPMIAAQIANAQGIRHTFMRDQTGRFVQLTDPKDIEVALNAGDEKKYYWTFTKDPSVQAFTDLLNRALDKPAEQEQAVTVTGALKIRWQDDDDD